MNLRWIISLSSLIVIITGCASPRSEFNPRFEIEFGDTLKLVDHSSLSLKERDEISVYQFREGDVEEFKTKYHYSPCVEMPAFPEEHKKFLEESHWELGPLEHLYVKHHRTNIPRSPKIVSYLNVQQKKIWFFWQDASVLDD